jgi:hypothetical protein
MEMAMPNDDLRADIDAAFASEAAPEPTSTPEVSPDLGTPEPSPEPQGLAAPETPIGEPQETAAEARARDEKGRFAKAQADAAAKPLEAPAKPVTPQTGTPTPPVVDVRAPQSWKPTIREKFAALPAEVQQEVIRREREIATTMQESAEARQGYQRFRETLAPFEHMIRSGGADPYQTVGSLMQTAMALQTGAPGNKAGIVANLIRHYGVDLNLLASTLEGQPVAPQEQQPYRDPRVDQLMAQVEQARSYKQQQLAQEATRLIGEIQGEEFFADVKDAMADILEVAAKRDVAMTPKEAYNRAVWADPHVAEVLQQRQAAKQAGNRIGSTQRAQAAAASIKGSPAVGGAPTQSGSLRGDIEAAADALRDR